MKKIIVVITCMLYIISTYAQEKKITITGKPIVTLFANYHAGIGHANDNSGFELDRSYLGYAFTLTEKLSGKVIFDIGPTKTKDSDLERIAYVKNAMLTWTPGNFTFDFGLIKLDQFSLQESFWGYRYILKSFDDEYKFGHSADMGIIAKYRFNKIIQGDLSITNGEGYKKMNKDNKYRYGAGITINPTEKWVVRVYADLYNTSEDSLRNQSTFSFFAGYKHKSFRIGAEYNKMFNTRFIDHFNREGVSLYTSVQVYKKIALFGRYDYLHSSANPGPEEDGQRLLAGLQYSPIKYLKLAPNFTNWNPTKGKANPYVYLNLEFKL